MIYDHSWFICCIHFILPPRLQDCQVLGSDDDSQEDLAFELAGLVMDLKKIPVGQLCFISWDFWTSCWMIYLKKKLLLLMGNRFWNSVCYQYNFCRREWTLFSNFQTVWHKCRIPGKMQPLNMHQHFRNYWGCLLITRAESWQRVQSGNL